MFVYSYQLFIFIWILNCILEEMFQHEAAGSNIRCGFPSLYGIAQGFIQKFCGFKNQPHFFAKLRILSMFCHIHGFIAKNLPNSEIHL